MVRRESLQNTYAGHKYIAYRKKQGEWRQDISTHYSQKHGKGIGMVWYKTEYVREQKEQARIRYSLEARDRCENDQNHGCRNQQHTCSISKRQTYTQTFLIRNYAVSISADKEDMGRSFLRMTHHIITLIGRFSAASLCVCLRVNEECALSPYSPSACTIIVSLADSYLNASTRLESNGHSCWSMDRQEYRQSEVQGETEGTAVSESWKCHTEEIDNNGRG